MTRLSALYAAALDLLLGSRCAGCGTPGRDVCAGCRPALTARPHVCWPDPAPSGLLDPDPVPPWAAQAYVDPLRRLLVAYKDRGRAGLAVPLGTLLAAVVEHALLTRLPAATCADLVPVPSAPASVRQRGRDVVADLARVAAGRLRRRGLDARVRPALVLTRSVADQAGLSATDRAANLTGALAARRLPARHRPVVVVDDVLTTGASAAEAVRALRAAGTEAAAVAVVAATPRRWPRTTAGPVAGSSGRPLPPPPLVG